MGRSSSKRQEILTFLRSFAAENGYAPSVREIGQAVGLRSTASVQYHLNELSRAGLIETDGGKNRAIRLPDRHGIPIVGTVAAGVPILAEENIDGYLSLDEGDGCFALRIQGDSMIEAHIFDGDKIIVRPQPTAENGEIVVALIGDEATCKRFSRKNGGVWLLPENPAYAPIDGRDAVILGKVCAVLHEL